MAPVTMGFVQGKFVVAGWEKEAGPGFRVPASPAAAASLCPHLRTSGGSTNVPSVDVEEGRGGTDV
jgi:hypothetical protein